MQDCKVLVVVPVYWNIGKNTTAYRERDIRRSIAERQSCIYRKEFVMLKKVAYGIVAGSLVLAAPAASAETQYLINGQWQGVSALPFSTSPSAVEVARGAAMPKSAPQVSATLTAGFPAPYNTSGGYFN